MNNSCATAELRKKFMTTRRVVCTGNPNRPGTLASGFVKLFPDAVFLSRSTGWNLANIDHDQKNKLQDIFSQCNTFLNCSYIDHGAQTSLLELCHESVKFCDVINVGSTHEYDGLGHEKYQQSKIHLREKSLQLNSFRFSTCHFILGGIKNDHSSDKINWLDIDMICKTMISVWNHPYHVPITSMDQFKEPW